MPDSDSLRPRLYAALGNQYVKVVVETGDFYCPTCRKKRTFQHELDRGWFVLFGFPIFSLADKNAHLKCDECGGHFELSLRDFHQKNDIEQVESSYANAFLQALVLLGSLKRSPMVIPLICDVYQRTFRRSHPIDQRLVEDKLITTIKTTGDVADCFDAIPMSIVRSRKEEILNALVTVAFANGQVGYEENELLMDFTELLGLPSERITEIFDQLTGASKKCIKKGCGAGHCK